MLQFLKNEKTITPFGVVANNDLGSAQLWFK